MEKHSMFMSWKMLVLLNCFQNPEGFWCTCAAPFLGHPVIQKLGQSWFLWLPILVLCKD